MKTVVLRGYRNWIIGGEIGLSKGYVFRRNMPIDVTDADAEILLACESHPFELVGETPDDPTEQEPESPLASLGLPAQAESALLAAGCDDPDVVALMSDDDLLAVSGIGKATLREIREVLPDDDVVDLGESLSSWAD